MVFDEFRINKFHAIVISFPMQLFMFSMNEYL
jgi:hypothetical protein